MSEGAAHDATADDRADTPWAADVPKGANWSLYWDEFYARKVISPPSPFAQLCRAEHIRGTDVILEAGCGCGRDSVFFGSNGNKVLAIDLSRTAIAKLQAAFAGNQRLVFRNADFTRLNSDLPRPDVVYSRWTLHTIDRPGQDRFLRWAREHLAPGGRLLVECRSVRDNLYGVGRMVGPDEFVTTHYRRFIRIDELERQLERLGFAIKYCEEGRGWSPHGTDDPVLIRVVATVEESRA